MEHTQPKAKGIVAIALFGSISGNHKLGRGVLECSELANRHGLAIGLGTDVGGAVVSELGDEGTGGGHTQTKDRRTNAIPKDGVGVSGLVRVGVVGRLEEEVEKLDIVVLHAVAIGRRMKSKRHLEKEHSGLVGSNALSRLRFEPLFHITVSAQLHSDVLELAPLLVTRNDRETLPQCPVGIVTAPLGLLVLGAAPMRRRWLVGTSEDSSGNDEVRTDVAPHQRRQQNRDGKLGSDYFLVAHILDGVYIHHRNSLFRVYCRVPYPIDSLEGSLGEECGPRKFVVEKVPRSFHRLGNAVVGAVATAGGGHHLHHAAATVIGRVVLVLVVTIVILIVAALHKGCRAPHADKHQGGMSRCRCLGP